MRLGLVGLFGLAACTAAADSDTDEGAFSVNQVSSDLSILPAVENSGGKPSVCVALIGFDPRARQATADTIASLVTDAARKWNALLRGNELWTLQGDVTPTYTFQESECPRTGPGFNVNVWATAEQFRAEYCSRPGYGCSPAAIASYRSVYLGPWNRTRPLDPYDPHVMLHEYGHLLGLGDTYRIPGATDWVGEQPPSVMNNGSRTLTQDDKLGLLVTLRELKTGVRSCDGIGENVEMTHNQWNTLMCNPSTRPNDTHARPTPPVELVLPKAGSWAFDGYDLMTTGLRVTSVERTASGFTMTVGGLEGGRPSGGEGPYHCTPSGTCAAASDARYRLLVTDATTMRMINPNTPAGIRVAFARP